MEKLATVRVEQPPSKALRNYVQPKQRAPDALEAEIKFSKKDDESLRIAATGKLNGMMMEGEKFSGHFDLRAALGANRKEADVDANIVATELPPQMRFLPIALPKGTTTLVLEGNFVTADKKLELRSVRLQSPLGDASGTGQVEFIPEITFSQDQSKSPQGSARGVECLCFPARQTRLRPMGFSTLTWSFAALGAPWRSWAPSKDRACNFEASSSLWRRSVSKRRCNGLTLHFVPPMCRFQGKNCWSGKKVRRLFRLKSCASMERGKPMPANP